MSLSITNLRSNTPLGQTSTVSKAVSPQCGQVKFGQSETPEVAQSRLDRIFEKIAKFFGPLGDFLYERGEIQSELTFYRGSTRLQRWVDRRYPLSEMPKSMQDDLDRIEQAEPGNWKKLRERKNRPQTREEEDWMMLLKVRGSILSYPETFRFMFWFVFGTKALVQATQHLHPEYNPADPQFKLPEPPAKLSRLDRFFIKHVFKTTPYGKEAER